MKELSPRERQVFGLVTYQNPQIGQILGIATATVKAHIRNIALKLGCYGAGKKRTKLITIALREGIMSFDDVAVGDYRHGDARYE